jgi:CrcB protein
MKEVLLVCLGGAAGSVARYLLSIWITGPHGGFPWGTMVVNLLGSFLLGLVAALAANPEIVSPAMRVALGTGVLGGFTTYSAFNLETLGLMSERSWSAAALNVSLTLAGCLVAGVAGMALGRRFVPA